MGTWWGDLNNGTCVPGKFLGSDGGMRDIGHITHLLLVGVDTYDASTLFARSSEWARLCYLVYSWGGGK